MKNIKRMKALAITATMALAMIAGDLCAQYDENRYGIQAWGKTGLMGKAGSGDSEEVDFGLPGSHGLEVDGTTPLGGGALLLIGLGAAYAFGKRRREE